MTKLNILLLYLINQVTENTATILDECGILTTCRGETFVKGAGYIKTYYVPLNENFNLIKKMNSMDFYRIEDRNRYFAIKARKFSNNSNSSSVYGYSTFDVRSLSFNSEATEDSFDLENARTATPMDDSGDEQGEFGQDDLNKPDVYEPVDLNAPVDVYEPVDFNARADVDNADVTSVSTESEVKETRC